MDVIAALVTAVWAMLPAYVPNNAAVLAGGGRPIDGGRSWGDRRVLGDGKTYRGTVVGWAVGAGVAVLLNQLNETAAESLAGVPDPFPIAVVIAFPLGAMLGDIGASFLKRRTGRQRGAPYPGVDQLDFVVGALLLGVLAAPAWFTDTFAPLVLGVVLVLTPLLHVTTNGIAYLIGVKDEPW